MAFEICPISSARRPLFDVREDRRACCLRSCEVSIEVLHVDEHPVDNPWTPSLFACLLAGLPMAFRTAAARRGDASMINPSPASISPCESLPVRRCETFRLPKPKRTAKPFQGRQAPFLVGDHRDDGWCAPGWSRLLAGSATFARRRCLSPAARRLRVVAAFLAAALCFRLAAVPRAPDDRIRQLLCGMTHRAWLTTAFSCGARSASAQAA